MTELSDYGTMIGVGNANPIQYSFLENSTDKGAYNQRAGYSPWGRKESDTIERFHFHFQKTLESPWECKEIKLVNPKGNQP